jgi:hypothetical protein
MEMESHRLFCLGWPGIAILCISDFHGAWDDRFCHCSRLSEEVGVSQTPRTDCPRTAILQISASQVARLRGMSHWCLAFTKMFDRGIMGLLAFCKNT